MVELSVVEQRYQAVLEVLGGATVVDVARRYGVARQTMHTWLRRYASDGLAGLVDRSSRPDTCPHQISAVIEAQIVEMRKTHPGWGPRRSAITWSGRVWFRFRRGRRSTGAGPSPRDRLELRLTVGSHSSRRKSETVCLVGSAELPMSSRPSTSTRALSASRFVAYPPCHRCRRRPVLGSRPMS